MNAILITPDNISDLTGDETLYTQFLNSGGSLWNSDLMKEFIVGSLDTDHVLMICMENGVFVGFALLNLIDSSCDTPDLCVKCVSSERCLYIELLGIHPSFRGQGKLKPLLAHIKSFAVRKNYTCMRLSALNSKVASLYEDHAFVFEVPENKISCNNMKNTFSFGNVPLRIKPYHRY